ncbi:integrase arm-type DNA-binding domain-containing protein [Rheinheimera sp. UJ63]|uniref:integrase arm-type DNA-binding domain-containing protein n=1 Tax=Rheinheimera sp. UJ63 TaxID=2910157 RepID=UPI003FA71FAE
MISAKTDTLQQKSTILSEVSLKDARHARDEARKQLAQGIAPSAEIQALKLANYEFSNSFKRTISQATVLIPPNKTLKTVFSLFPLYTF